MKIARRKQRAAISRCRLRFHIESAIKGIRSFTTLLLSVNSHAFVNNERFLYQPGMIRRYLLTLQLWDRAARCADRTRVQLVVII